MIGVLVRAAAVDRLLACALLGTVIDAPAVAQDGVVRASVDIDSGTLQLKEYEEQFGEFVPEFMSRRWRSALCVELSAKDEQSRPRRIWQTYFAGRFEWGPEMRPRDLRLSGLNGRRLLFAFVVGNDIYAAPVSLDNTVIPLAEDAELGTTRTVADPERSRFDGYSLFRQSRLESALGIKLGHRHRISVHAASKTDDGWRVDASVEDTMSPRVIEGPEGKVIADYAPKPILRFSVLFDKECKSANIEVAKERKQP